MSSTPLKSTSRETLETSNYCIIVHLKQTKPQAKKTDGTNRSHDPENKNTRGEFQNNKFGKWTKIGRKKIVETFLYFFTNYFFHGENFSTETNYPKKILRSL